MRRPALLLVAAIVLVASSAATTASAQVAPTVPSAAPTTTSVPSETPSTVAPSPSTSTPSTAIPTTTAPPTTADTTTAPPPAAPPVTAAAGTTEATNAAPKVRGVGDSVFRSAESKVTTRLRPEYRPRFRSVLGATIAEMTPTAREMAGNGPAAMVLGLGNPDIAEMDAGLNPYPAATRILGATFHVPCVVWVNVKERGVNAFYHQQWAQVAGAFNDWLVNASVDGSGNDLYFPNLHVLDWNQATVGHPGWFLADGLHLNETGQANYARKIDRFLNRVCPPTPG